MPIRSTATRWGALLQLFHWGMLLLFATNVSVGFYMTGLALSPGKLRVYAIHKSIGITLLALALLRALWRLSERRPLLAPMSAWQQRAAGVTHLLLYALMFAIPLSGWLYNSAAGFPLQWFRLVNLPALAAADPHLKATAKQIHESGAIALITLVVMHAMAAFKHHFIDHDRTLAAMLPWRKDLP